MTRLLIILLVSLRALRRNVMRTLLTMLGIIIGVGAVITTVSISTGGREMIEKETAAMGKNVIMVMAGSGFRGGVRSGFGGASTLTLEDAAAIAAEIEGAPWISPEVRGTVQVASSLTNWNCQVMGQSDVYLELRSWPLVEGVFFGPGEVETAARVAILGQTTAKRLFEQDSPVGQTIRIKDVPFTVIGLLSAKGSNTWGQDQDDVVLIPYTTAMRRVLGQTTVRIINVSAISPEAIEPVVEQITTLLRQRHRITPEKEDDFNIRTQQEIADFRTSISRIMTPMLYAIAAVSLVVGGIGIMNIMLVSVTERTREIGVRLAVGAKRGDVMRQFLAEAVLVTALGGALGILAGLGTSALVAKIFLWPIVTPMLWIGIAFGGSAVIGIVFGLYPAVKASGLDPIEALRYE
jgi:putative ABC transport system permease protein